LNQKVNDWLVEHAPESKIGMHEPVMSIGAASEISGLSESALRKYESAGLIIFFRTATRRRLLSMEDLERIRLIQNFVKKQGLNLEGILRLWTLVPCWELKQCSEKYKDKCEALTSFHRPCWVLMKNKGCAGNLECRDCEVYRFGAYCTEDLKSLIHKV